LIDSLRLLGTRALRFDQLLGQLRNDPVQQHGIVGQRWGGRQHDAQYSAIAAAGDRAITAD
jgi:hypothetical protein